jgi:hypothetical protein
MAVSIISPEGRAFEAQMHHYQMSGMPPDQIMQHINQGVGMIPFPELLALKMQYDRIRQSQPPQQQQPPPTTVAQDMKQGLMGGQPHAVGPNAPGMPPGPMQQQNPMQGVSGLPTGNLGQHMSGGGIVAFADGGDADAVLLNDQFLAQQQDYMNKAISGKAKGGVAHFDEGGPTWSQYLGIDPNSPAGKMIAASHGSTYAGTGEAAAPVSAYLAGLPKVAAAQPRGPQAIGGAAPAPIGSPSPSAPSTPSAPPQNLLPPPNDPRGISGLNISARGGIGGIGNQDWTSVDEQLAAQRAAIPSVRSLSDVADEAMDIKKKYGLGAAASIYNSQIDKMESDLTGQKDYMQKMALAQGGFAMAQQASIRGNQPGYGGKGLQGFLAAAAAGGTRLSSDMISNEAAIRASKMKLVEDRYRAAQALETDDRATLRDVVQDHRTDVRDHQQAVNDAAKTGVEIARAKVQEELANARALMSTRAMMTAYNKVDENKARLDQLRPILLDPTTPPDKKAQAQTEYDQRIQMQRQLSESTPAGLSAEDRLKAAHEKAMATDIRYQSMYAQYTKLKDGTPEKLAAAEQIRKYLLGPSQFTSGATTAPANASGWSIQKIG